MTDEFSDRAEILHLTASIISAFVGNNSIASADLPGVISGVFAELNGLGAAQAEPEAGLVPAVPIKKSIARTAIICLDCGRSFKMLKRHISTDHNLTPAEYRNRWSLGHDYPMVAPQYSEQRKKLAEKTGLGRKPEKAPPKRKRSKKA